MKKLRVYATGTFLRLSCSSIFALLLGISLVAPLAAQAPVPDSPAIEAKAHEMLSKLTLEQKIELIGGVDSMFTNAMPCIELPRFKMSDASVGVRTWGPTTAYAGGVALAATWDREFARTLGESLGRDARARGVNFLLGPGVNIARSPIGGRNFEYLSEDPYLNSELVVPYVEGVQSQGVIATVKHYALNNQEFDRHDASSDVDERTMREIYLPAFEAAVTRGHADSVMNSYNLVNNIHSTQNEFLNLKVLKGEWGFKGILMSDWDATYDGVAAANNGLDLEMPSPKFMNEQNLLPAVKSGAVNESAIDDKVLRLLRTELRYGFTERPQLDPADATYSVTARAVALRGALESITLLKNEGHLLPLDSTKVKTVAVIGPDAWPAVTGGGGSSLATAFDPVSIVVGVGKVLGPNGVVLYSRGLPELTDVFRKAHWQGGVKVETFANRSFSGTPTTGTRSNLTDWQPQQWMPAGPARSIRYTANFTAAQGGRYLLVAATAGEDGLSLTVDGKSVFGGPPSDGAVPQSYRLDLAAGQTIHIQADYLPHGDANRFSMGVMYEPDLVSAEAKEYAAKADAVVVAVGFDAVTEGEGHDRTFDLPWGQAALIDAMVAANPRTIITLTGGGGMNVEPWVDTVPALVDDWYPGQEGGTAVAQILFGRHDPEGRLPVSFDRAWSDGPSYPWYYGNAANDTVLHTPGENGKPVDYTTRHIVYGDKLMVGYRYWTTTGKHPLFPFGFGLSYTTFSYSNLKVPAAAASGSTVPVSFDVTNTGGVEGSEVAQVYVSDRSANVSRPERELKGFEKVHLSPGETKHVTLELDARAFSYWSDGTHNWAINPGKFVVRVGGSSEDTPLDGEITLQ